jgi:hypothetical protein
MFVEPTLLSAFHRIDRRAVVEIVGQDAIDFLKAQRRQLQRDQLGARAFVVVGEHMGTIDPMALHTDRVGIHHIKIAFSFHPLVLPVAGVSSTVARDPIVVDALALAAAMGGFRSR